MSHQPRVVITGLGAVAPNGVGKDVFWQALKTGRSGISRLTHFDATHYPCRIAGEIRDFHPLDYLNYREMKRLPRVCQLGVVAAKMAWEDAGLQITEDNATKIGVCFGTSVGKAEVIDTEHQAFLQKGTRAIHPLSFALFAPHSVSSSIAMALGTKGVCETLSTGCTVGLDAIEWAALHIRLGKASAIIVGGAEALLTPFAFGAICATGVLSTRNETPHSASRPFEKHRDGLVASEGAGALVLENLEHAQARGATPYAEVLGYATARDGEDFVHCDLSGAVMAQVLDEALDNARLPLKRLDYINAHGNGMRDYDTAETNAIKATFARHAYHIPVSSIKSMIGQPFAAAGALQVVATCLTLQHGMLPPTINYDTPDPCCDLDYVPHRARRARVRTALIHAHGMAGSDSALIIGDCKPA